ncbi:polymerase III polypeptide H [Coprinopsis sp. MPI-PUGE-AT-0042]|nr:polymerase III polypeptide H [Coprinopsis sp. MPI-PUGE-AT-0042]
MFCLSVIRDAVRIHPQHFSDANRAPHDVGLCVCVFNLTDVGDGKVRYGDETQVLTFRLTVFYPSSDEDAIQPTMGFFDAMYIPAIYLPQPSALFVAHVWLPDSEFVPTSEMLDTPISERMHIDQNEVIRVEQDEFFDDEPGPPKVVERVIKEKATAWPPYTITCSILEHGLGLLVWCRGAQQVVEGEEEAKDKG